jgi:hypothetical protein
MPNVADNSGRARSQRLIGRIKATVSRAVNGNELRDIGRAEFSQIARDLNLSPLELHKLSIGNGSSPALLEKRLAEFDFAPELVKRLHPEVLRDLQRVCAMCASTNRCAREFARREPASPRSEYCPNTQTLEALEREKVLSNAQQPLPSGPSCC